MATYNSLTSRTDVQGQADPPGGLIPEDAARDIIQDTIKQSAVLSSFRRVTMSRKQLRMPVLSTFPTAYFVDGDTGLKQTTEMAWSNKYLNAEEIAALVPVPNAVLDDADYDLWGEIRPRVAEAVGRALDAAVFFGTNAPATWPEDISDAVAAAGNTEADGETAANGGVAADISNAMAKVEDDGFDVNAFVTYRGFRASLRNARDADGQRLLEVREDGQFVYGQPISYVMDGLWPDVTSSGNDRLFALDAEQFIVGVRQDLTAEVFGEGPIVDASGAVIFNPMQQDSKVLRVVARFAWQVANPKTHSNTSDVTRYPAAALRKA